MFKRVGVRGHLGLGVWGAIREGFLEEALAQGETERGMEEQERERVLGGRTVCAIAWTWVENSFGSSQPPSG